MMIKVTELTQTCSACPSQWEGLTSDDRKIYVRYRWGYLSVRIGEIDDMSAAVSGEEIFGISHGDGFDGCLDYEELVTLTKGKVQW